MGCQEFGLDPKVRYRYLDKKGEEAIDFFMAYAIPWFKRANALIFSQFWYRKPKIWGERIHDLKPVILRIQIWWMEMEETAFTNIPSTFYHKKTNNFAQNAFLNQYHKRIICYPVAASTAREAGKMSRVTAQALLSLLAWSE
jgi:hypothetical protein